MRCDFNGSSSENSNSVPNLTLELPHPSLNPLKDPILQAIGRAVAADVAFVKAKLTGDERLANTVANDMSENSSANWNLAISLLLTTRAGEGPSMGPSEAPSTVFTRPSTIVVDSKGNAFPLRAGESVTGSKDGTWIQVRDAAGDPTGMRIDGPHSPRTHTDPRALQPHAHVPGITNEDGTPWLPVYP